MILDNVLHLLDYIQFGACVADREENIVYWNSGAEQILGYRSRDIVGLTCFDLISGIAEEASLLLDLKKEQARRMDEGYLPEPFTWRLRGAMGGFKILQVVPVVVPDLSLQSFHVVYLFGELPLPLKGTSRGLRGEFPESQGFPVGVVFGNGRMASDGSVPTLRELEVLRLVSRGMDVAKICEELHLSIHTVLNHIRNARRKLGARTRMDAVLTAMRRGLI